MFAGCISYCWICLQPIVYSWCLCLISHGGRVVWLSLSCTRWPLKDPEMVDPCLEDSFGFRDYKLSLSCLSTFDEELHWKPNSHHICDGVPLYSIDSWNRVMKLYASCLLFEVLLCVGAVTQRYNAHSTVKQHFHFTLCSTFILFHVSFHFTFQLIRICETP